MIFEKLLLAERKTRLFFVWIMFGCPFAFSQTWQRIEFDELVSGDTVVIVDGTSGGAMSNDNGTTSPPLLIGVEFNDDSAELVADSLTSEVMWIIEQLDEGVVFHPLPMLDKWLYCINSNNGVRVGTGVNRTFEFYAE
ncbi:MAG: hypothetical protein MJZ76_08415, partial [Bacteroidales bacterium]|nr:hypothetical protein [Bacteroidales bacterium]